MVVNIYRVIKEESIKNRVFRHLWPFFGVFRGFLWELEFLMKELGLGLGLDVVLL